MLKQYKIGSLTYQFEEGAQPAGAVEVKKTAPKADPEPEPKKKASKPKNKARKVENKEA